MYSISIIIQKIAKFVFLHIDIINFELDMYHLPNCRFYLLFSPNLASNSSIVGIVPSIFSG